LRQASKYVSMTAFGSFVFMGFSFPVLVCSHSPPLPHQKSKI